MGKKKENVYESMSIEELVSAKYYTHERAMKHLPDYDTSKFDSWMKEYNKVVEELDKRHRSDRRGIYSADADNCGSRKGGHGGRSMCGAVKLA